MCCDGACSGQCQACAENNKVGTCTTVTGAPRGTRPQCNASQTTCAGSCGGLSDQCSYPGSSVVCAAAVCSGELSVQPASVCNSAGACTSPTVTSCGAGKYCSGDSCVSQNANGGSCQGSNQCASGNCSNGLCCSSSQTGCGSSCVSLSSSNANCGSCGRPCAAGSSCSGGSCYLADGQSCTTGTQCLSGVCSTFYYDGDHDNYGTPNTTTIRCGTTPPAGYAANSGDCCDSDANAYPGSSYSSATTDACGSYDYNCDTQGTPVLPDSYPQKSCGSPTCVVSSDGTTCVYSGGCTCAGSGEAACTWYAKGSCGQEFTTYVYKCAGPTGGSCHVYSNQAPGGSQECN